MKHICTGKIVVQQTLITIVRSVLVQLGESHLRITRLTHDTYFLRFLLAHNFSTVNSLGNSLPIRQTHLDVVVIKHQWCCLDGPDRVMIGRCRDLAADFGVLDILHTRWLVC